MQRKITRIEDANTKILSKTGIGFYAKNNNNLTDTILRQTLYFGNINVSLNPKFSNSCIIIPGYLLDGLISHTEEEDFTIGEDNRIDIYIISQKKLFKRKSKHTIHIYPLKEFFQLENISELYIKFFKYCPFNLSESIKYIFNRHKTKIINKKYYQSEFVVLYIAYVNSRVESTFNNRYKILHLIKFLYKLFLLIKSFSTNELFKYWKNNSHYFLVYNKEMYENYFEDDFIILNEV